MVIGGAYSEMDMTREEIEAKIIKIIKDCSVLDGNTWDDDGDYSYSYSDASLAAYRILEFLKDNNLLQINGDH